MFGGPVRCRAEEATNVGNIVKYGIERLEHRNLELSLDCPNCGATRITFSSGNGSLNDIKCPKCGIRVILDSLNLTVVNERRHESFNAHAEAASPA